LEGTPIPWNPNGLLLPERPQFTYDPLFQRRGVLPAGVLFPMVIQSVVSQLLAEGPERPCGP